MLQDITQKGDFFFSRKNKKDNKSLHFRFLFLFLLKKKNLTFLLQPCNKVVYRYITIH